VTLTRIICLNSFLLSIGKEESREIHSQSQFDHQDSISGQFSNGEHQESRKTAIETELEAN
jgi:hypothetical protein